MREVLREVEIHGMIAEAFHRHATRQTARLCVAAVFAPAGLFRQHADR